MKKRIKNINSLIRKMHLFRRKGKRIHFPKIHFNGFYSKMIFICIVALSTTSLILAIVVSSFAEKYEQNEFLKKYDIALSDLHSDFQSKHKNFNNTLSSLFKSPAGYSNLCSLLKTSNYNDLDSTTKYNAIEIINNICDRDMNCIGILLYSEAANQLYQYDLRYQSLNQIPLSGEWPEHTPYSLGILGDDQISSHITYFNKPASHIYGMVGTIYEYFGSSHHILGQIIVLYPTSEYLDTLNDYSLDPESMYSIVDAKGDVIFRSSGEYMTSDDLIIDYKDVTTLNILSSPSKIATLKDKDYYTASIYNGRYNYYVNYQIEKTGKHIGYTQNLILLFALFTCICSIGLYIMTFYLAEKKVRFIQKGMAKIGSINLTYRIPPVKGQDEYTQIINGFNRMCDELQRNVEQSYINELQQKRAELYALQTSINPHFLYNTLEQIRLQALQGNTSSASQMILILSKIYRNQTNREMYVSLEEELEQCENLIYLYQHRYNIFEYEFDIPDELYRYALPKNTLQPLIENYFYHGLDQATDDNFLKLEGKLTDIEGKPYILLTFWDNGKSIQQEELLLLKEKLNRSVFENDGTDGFALSNVNSRLKIVFGDNCGIEPDVGDHGTGFKITITILPKTAEELRQNGAASK